MGHLNKLQEEYDAKGLTILSATGESKEIVEGFVEEFGATFPILCKAQTGSYSTGGVPHAYLIAADGTVAWQGHPGKLQDDEIEGFLKDVAKPDRVSTWSFSINKQLPVIPAKLASARKDLDKKKFGSALKKVETELKKLTGEDKEHGEKMKLWISALAEDPMSEAASKTRDGDIFAAYLLYEQVEADFKGHAYSKQAKEAAKTLTKNKAHKTEIKAGEKLVDIKKEIRAERKPEDQLALLKPLLSKKYAETKAGKEAAALAKKIEAKIVK